MRRDLHPAAVPRAGGIHLLPQKVLHPPAAVPLRSRIAEFRAVRVVPGGNHYVIEVLYDREPVDLGLDKRRALGVDLGVNNLVTAADNAGVRPFIVKGGVPKSANHYYNKRLAQLQSAAARGKGAGVTRRIQRLAARRNAKVADFFHKTSRFVVNYCIAHDIGTIAIGYNAGWKQRCALGPRANQTFVNLPFQALVQQVQY